MAIQKMCVCMCSRNERARWEIWRIGFSFLRSSRSYFIGMLRPYILHRHGSSIMNDVPHTIRWHIVGAPIRINPLDARWCDAEWEEKYGARFWPAISQREHRNLGTALAAPYHDPYGVGSDRGRLAKFMYFLFLRLCSCCQFLSINIKTHSRLYESDRNCFINWFLLNL